ncbi:MAG: hypothetical protein DMF97_21450, partial [Acidobacteria bacterium]
VRWWPTVSATTLVLAATTASLSLAAGFDGGRSAAAILGIAAAWVMVRACWQCSAAVGVIELAVSDQE